MNLDCAKFAENVYTDYSARTCANVLGVRVDAVDMDAALARVAAHLRSGAKGYVCAVGVHGVMEAQHDPLVARAFDEAMLVVPDGTPIVWVGWRQGMRAMQAVPGPDLMLRIFADDRFAQCRHFFYGGKPGVAQDLAAAMRRRFPHAAVVGTYTPPFHEWSKAEEASVIRQINTAQPDMVWVGISTPRQELWMSRILPKLDTRLMFGVGAAFDFHTGRIRNCPPWVKRAGLHWLHRLMQDPKRLWRRNLANIPFLWQIAAQFAGLSRYARARDQ